MTRPEVSVLVSRGSEVEIDWQHDGIGWYFDLEQRVGPDLRFVLLPDGQVDVGLVTSQDQLKNPIRHRNLEQACFANGWRVL